MKTPLPPKMGRYFFEVKENAGDPHRFFLVGQPRGERNGHPDIEIWLDADITNECVTALVDELNRSEAIGITLYVETQGGDRPS